ncbi:MAG: hypothetical protein KJ893_04905 [Candidatus Omnitrophica bacterium]|nr:hypothetical protein [Candidatus Omnitrophota bacterium]
MKFEELAGRIDFRLRQISRKLDGRYTAFNDDDLYQEALLYLWRKYENEELADKNDAYILKGCFYFLKNYIRTMHKSIDVHLTSLNKPINLDGTTLEDVICADNFESMTDVLNIDLLREQINGILNEREIGILSMYSDGFTVREIGKKLNISHVMVVKIKNKINEKCERFKEICKNDYQKE